ncbi:hypothetical protein EZS27_029245 [termite gut metagenome]|uniref:Uncharacterized protein n=1 Tax=termite gut metagenome TaxID=433724 RepID=A0A5J4QJ73_9ZZZZ
MLSCLFKAQYAHIFSYPQLSLRLAGAELGKAFSLLRFDYRHF